MRWMGWAPAALIAHHLALAPPAQATTMAPMSVAELAEEADLVVVGRGREADAVHANQALTRVMTQVRVEVLEIWKGALPTAERHVDVVTLGGQMGAVEQKVYGAAQLPIDGVMVLFLVGARGRTGEYHVLGLSQGVWHLGPLQLPIPPDAPISQTALLPTQAARRGHAEASGPATFADLGRLVHRQLGPRGRLGGG